MISLIYFIFAVIGLGFLVFIHELGHYIMARRAGMKVEAFAIGIGKPIFTWVFQDVKWHICMLPFGGYVKIAGTQKEGRLEPSEIPDGFYGKSPWKRIQVALAGPLVNVAFAFVVFFVLWMAGGRDKQFSEFTHRIGWVDPHSALYTQGVRPGDVIERYDGRPFNGLKDILIASAMDGKSTQIEGYKIDYETGDKIRFDYTLNTYENPNFTKEKLQTIGIFSPASYLIFSDRGMPPNSPIEKSGIRPGDRLIWADGEVLFSLPQLTNVVNDSTALLTARRGNEIFQTRIPRIHLDDLKMTSYERAEIDDWQHEAGLKGRLQDLFFIPYNLSPTLDVESRLNFIDEKDQVKAFFECQRCGAFNPLQEGDVILAVDGVSVHTSYQLLQQLQSRRVLLIVERDPAATQNVLWKIADDQFDQFNIKDLQSIVMSIGTEHPVYSAGHLHLLSPVVPLSYRDFPLSPEAKAQQEKEFERRKIEIESIKDPQKRIEAQQQLESAQRRLVLGAPLGDREVTYNPTPGAQFYEVLDDTWRTLTGLFTGNLNPKFVTGPVGIIQVVQHSWTLGAKEALFWMAIISLNLGLINLLPLPVLDGGHILFSIVELFTKRPIKSKTMERLIIPFVGLLVAFFIYVTFQDITRLFGKLF